MGLIPKKSRGPTGAQQAYSPEKFIGGSLPIMNKFLADNLNLRVVHF